MSNELEAFKRLKYIYAIDKETHRNDLNIIEKALQRNVALEPIQNNNPRYYDCPNCQENVSSDEDYCCYCGQKLDWSDE